MYGKYGKFREPVNELAILAYLNHQKLLNLYQLFVSVVIRFVLAHVAAVTSVILKNTTNSASTCRQAVTGALFAADQFLFEFASLHLFSINQTVNPQLLLFLL